MPPPTYTSWTTAGSTTLSAVFCYRTKMEQPLPVEARPPRALPQNLAVVDMRYPIFSIRCSKG